MRRSIVLLMSLVLTAPFASFGVGGAQDSGLSDEVATIVSRDIFFDPNEVTIPADTDVTFVLPNEGAAPHNFRIDELGIDIDIAPGATQEVVINAPDGIYEFWCDVPGHREAGMVGTLMVGSGVPAPSSGATAVRGDQQVDPTATIDQAAAGDQVLEARIAALETQVAAIEGTLTSAAAGTPVSLSLSAEPITLTGSDDEVTDDFTLMAGRYQVSAIVVSRGDTTSLRAELFNAAGGAGDYLFLDFRSDTRSQTYETILLVEETGSYFLEVRSRGNWSITFTER